MTTVRNLRDLYDARGSDAHFAQDFLGRKRSDKPHLRAFDVADPHWAGFLSWLVVNEGIGNSRLWSRLIRKSEDHAAVRVRVAETYARCFLWPLVLPPNRKCPACCRQLHRGLDVDPTGSVGRLLRGFPIEDLQLTGEELWAVHGRQIQEALEVILSDCVPARRTRSRIARILIRHANRATGRIGWLFRGRFGARLAALQIAVAARQPGPPPPTALAEDEPVEGPPAPAGA